LNKIPEQTSLSFRNEFFTVGFSMNESVAESLDGISASWLRYKSSETGIAFLASVPVKAEDKFFNRAIFVTPEGYEYYYDKRHLFSVGGEDKIFSPLTGDFTVDCTIQRVEHYGANML